MQQRLNNTNPVVSAVISSLRRDIGYAFGPFPRLAGGLLRPFLLWTARREERRLANGLTYKPSPLLYCPDNGVTRNFMPHLWMFLLQSLTPREHEVLLIDGNTEPMSDADVVRYVLDRKIGLVGIGAMTRMVAKGIPGCRCGSRRRRAGRDGRTPCD